MEKILREVLAENKNILARRDDLISALNEKVPPELKRKYASIRKALELNVGEIFAIGEEDHETAKAKATQILKDSGMQEARVNLVIETFVKALDWDKPPVEIEPPPAPKPPPKKSVEEIFNKAKVEAPPPPPVKIEKAEPQAAPWMEPPEVEVEPVSPVKKMFTQATPKVEELVEQTRAKMTELQSEAAPKVEEIVEQTRAKMSELQSQASGAFPQNQVSTIFTTEGRLNRWAYFIQGLKVLAILFVGAIITEAISGFIGGVVMLAGVIGAWMLGIRRLHDLDRSGWWMLIGLIPYVNFIFSIYMVFFKGTDGYNRYGADPLRG